MNHYAKIQNGRVVQVIRANEDFFTTFKDTTPGRWLQTSYNTRANQHNLGGTPLRGNFAGVGYSYDAINDVFIPPQPHPDATLDRDTWTWVVPDNVKTLMS